MTAFFIRFLCLVAAVALTSWWTSGAGAQTLPPDFQESVVFSGLTNPTVVQFASDGRVFVAEKSGLIKVFDSLTDTTPDVFADLRTNVHNFWDRGLLGLALHPNFPTTPDVYALYTHDAAIGGTAPRWGTAGATSDGCPTPPGATGDGCVVSGRLSRLQASGNVMVGNEQVLIEAWCQQYPSHSIGALAFGSDGALYVSGGDGASFNFVDYGQDGNPLNPCGDPPAGIGGVQSSPTAEGGSLRSQSVRRPIGEPVLLNGTILRVDPTTGDALPDNPLIGHVDPNARRIVAHGLRNPFRITTRPGTNEVWVGDVGWTAWEEIDRVDSPTASVKNFGWPCYEGGGGQPGYDGANLNLCETLYSAPSNLTSPLFTYNHSAKVVSGESCPTGSSSIAGLAFYNGGTYPTAYNGALFFADYSRDCIWVMFNPPGPTATNGFVAAYAFNEGSGTTAADVSGNGHTGALVNGPAWTTGKYDSGLSFDGVNDYGEVANPSGFDFAGADFTIEAWVQRNGGLGGDGREILSKSPNTGWVSGSKEFYLNGANKIAFGSFDTGEVASTGTITDANWHHVAVTFQASSKLITLYIDGVQNGSGTLALVSDGVGHVVRVGTIGFSPTQYFQGLIDEIRIYSRALSASEIQTDMTTPIDAAQPPAQVSTFVAGASGPVDLKIGPGGDLYYADFDGGTIRRIRYVGANTPPTAVIQATPTSGPAQLEVNFDGSGSSDPDPGDTVVSYAWDLDGDGQFDDASTPQVTFTYTAPGSYSVRLQVTDNRGETGTSGPTVITVGPPNNPPTATMDAPLPTLTWQVGDLILFSGQATDPEDGDLPASQLAWSVILHHCPSNCHTHPLQDLPGVAGGSFSAPDHEYPSHLEFKLTATDSGGQTDTKSVLVYPKTVALSFQSNPSGLQLVVGSTSSATPFTRTVIQGSNNSLSALSPQVLSGTNYAFASWSDGGAQTHSIIASAPVTYTATYVATGPSGLVAAYGFNEGSGTVVADASGNGHTGTLAGAAWTAAGKYGQALSFDGINDWVTVADSSLLDLTTGLTMMAWVNPTATSGVRDILIKEGTNVDIYNLYARNGQGQPESNVFVGGLNRTAQGAILPVNTWTHLAGTYDGTTLRLYVNGVLMASTAITGSIATSTGALRIGGNSIWGEYFQGRIDEVRIYNRTLSTSEIQTDMSAPVGNSNPNTPPTISDITDRAINEDANTGAIPFTVGDAETAVGSLAVSGSSSNLTLVPNGNIVFGGSGASRTVTVSPAANQSGTATITVTVSDGSVTASDPFVLTVNAVNDPPTISNIADQSTTVNTATAAIPFTVGDAETAVGSLAVSGSSSNLTLVPNGNIVFGGSGASRTVTVSPAANQSGTATITVTVSDGSVTASDPFVLTVNAQPAGLVAAYAFNEGSGTTAADVSGNGHTGTLAGAAWTAAGKYGQALSFDGINDWVTVADSSLLDLTTGLTMMAWVNPTATSGVRDILIKEGTNVDIYNLYARNGQGQPESNVFVGGLNRTAQGAILPVNTWTHLAGTYDGTTLRLYVNGVLMASTAITGSIATSTGALRIGGNSIWGEYFQGRIDEIRIYNRALTAGEIQTDMATSVQP